MVQRRTNYVGTLTDAEAVKLAYLITDVGGGSDWVVWIYCDKENWQTVKEYLSKFGSKYPYKAITWWQNHIRYDCKGVGGVGTERAYKLFNELQYVLRIRRELMNAAYANPIAKTAIITTPNGIRLEVENPFAVKGKELPPPTGSGSGSGAGSGKIFQIDAFDTGFGTSKSPTSTSGGSSGSGGDTTDPNKSNINNLLLYIGVGAAAFLVVFLIMRRKKK